jgi:amino acid transporter
VTKEAEQSANREEQMKKQIRKVLFGRPLRTAELKKEKLGVLWGLPMLSSDAISSVAYAGQEMLLVMLPAVGIMAYGKMSLLSWCIIGLLGILVISYRQTIDAYPGGGGAFTVAKENLGTIPGMMAGAALTVGYIMTVAVSISSGVEQIVSAFQILIPYKVAIAVGLVLLLMVGNLRGVRESAKMFGLPAYAFILGMLIMIGTGAFKVAMGYNPPEPNLDFGKPVAAVSMLLLLKAFAAGCTALTGVEAVSNSVPNFKKPAAKHAKMVLLLLALIILVLFAGTSAIANIYHVVPGEDGALLILIAREIFGNSFMYYYITATTFIILILAANTAFSGFPVLVAVMSKEEFAPKQLSMRGDRLSFDNGIIALSVIAILLIVGFSADVTSLIGLYAIGVFISFTLSQTGMLMRWLRSADPKRKFKAFINGFGAFITALVSLIIAVAKFTEGAWIVIVLIPLMVFLMDKVNMHYYSVRRQLDVSKEELAEEEYFDQAYKNKIIVPIENLNMTSVRTLRYAMTISDNVVAFHISMDDEDADRTQAEFDALELDIPLVIKMSPYRKVVDPLLRYIESSEYDRSPGDMITVLISDFMIKKWWHRFLHNNTTHYIEKSLLKHKHIVVSIMPYQLHEDSEYEKEYRKSLKRNKK